MREAHYGIFLLVNRGSENDRKRWRVDNRNRVFEDLIRCLREEAEKIVSSSATIRGLEVLGIDLTKRDGEPKAATIRLVPRATKRRRRS